MFVVVVLIRFVELCLEGVFCWCCLFWLCICWLVGGGFCFLAEALCGCA